MKLNKKVVMLILDGWGICKPDKFNAIDNAKHPNYDKLIKKYPNILLKSDGPAVGLPEGQFGTSEINHQIMGGGRIIYQDLPKINHEIETGRFYTNVSLVKTNEHVNKNKSALHLIGILSDGGIHSSILHLKALLKLAKLQGIEKTFLHVFTDGRDTPPKSAKKYFDILQTFKKEFNFEIATIQGRFWLDRDRDWEKTKTAVDLITEGKGNYFTSPQNVIDFSYNQKIDDEFFKQFILEKNGTIKPDDAVILFNYRTDRAYQIIKELLDRKIKNLMVTTFVEVSEEFKQCLVAFPRQEINLTLSEVLSVNKRRQYHLSETEKFTHITKFFNGGREVRFDLEDWEVVESNRFIKPQYNLEPSMKCFTLAQKTIDKIEESKTDFIMVNFPNADMVGHLGNYNAAVVAVEAVDYCLGKIYTCLENKLDKYCLIITADHGNSEQMWDYINNQPHSQHTLNPVPFIFVSDIKCKLDKKESLQDVAPTILYVMGIDKPEIMTGNSLIIHE